MLQPRDLDFSHPTHLEQSDGGHGSIRLLQHHCTKRICKAGTILPIPVYNCTCTLIPMFVAVPGRYAYNCMHMHTCPGALDLSQIQLYGTWGTRYPGTTIVFSHNCAHTSLLVEIPVTQLYQSAPVHCTSSYKILVRN